MKNYRKTACATFIVLIGISVHAQSGDLIYKPINPSFGGDPFTGSYLLGKAQSQDTNTDPNARRGQTLSSTERLLQSLESRLISQLISDVSRGEVSEGKWLCKSYRVTFSV
ncbi:curli assembly protein CsgF, partial [Halomonas sp. 3A7M]|uniref:curli assembly protein CsgF n=1 Tax=Halomonas sp. 3A7M TaxID=2742616 RepID=UPI0018673F5A